MSVTTNLHGESVLVPPRPLAFLVLAAAGLAAVVAGAIATTHLLLQVTVPWRDIPRAHWLAVVATILLSLVSLGIRSLRWVFLLRRTQTYVPLRDSLIIYLAGLSLVFVPFLAGETFLRALIARQRRVAPAEAVFVVNYWERALDLVALGAIAALAAGLTGRIRLSIVLALALVVTTLARPVRRALLTASMRLARVVARPIFGTSPSVTVVGERRLIGPAAYGVAMLLSLAAWVLPGLGLWLLARAWNGPASLLLTQEVFATASLVGGLLLAPGGVFVVGTSMLMRLAALGFDPSAATLVVFALRVATVGVAIALGFVLLAYHFARRAATTGPSHFDAIAEVYDAQIPETRRRTLLDRKTRLMDRILATRGGGLRGLDVGCGQGHYVSRMRALGYTVVGIDDSPLQVERARERFTESNVIGRGSVLEIPYGDCQFDFAYCINVLHHLDSFESQQRAFREIGRVLKPGGLLFLHEINTRNWLFRFYMGYLFPALNCIDEGVEHWLLPHRLDECTDLAIRRVEYFTFLPDFVPAAVVRWLTPIERRLEASRLGRYSAHYMAVFEKPG